MVYCIQRNPSCECAPLFCDLAPNFKMARMIKLLAHNHKNCCRKIPDVVTLFPWAIRPSLAMISRTNTVLRCCARASTGSRYS